MTPAPAAAARNTSTAAANSHPTTKGSIIFLMVVKNRKAHLLREETRNKLRQEVASGRCWYIALLKIVASCADEERLIDEEAFDLWGLARKMALEVRDIVPEYELEIFLQGRLPIKLSGEELANIIGPKVYSYHLNFFYGVVVEDALIHLTQNEILREGFFLPKHNLRDEAYLKVYGLTRGELTQLFIAKRGHSPSQEELYYFGFKYRLSHTEKEKLASDTKKALLWLERKGSIPLYNLDQ